MKKNIRVFIMLIAMTLSIIPSGTNIVKAAQTQKVYTDENASFANKVFTLAVANKVDFVKKNGKAYAEFVASYTGRYKFEITSSVGDKGTLKIYDDVEDDYAQFNFVLQSENFYVDLNAGRKYTVEVEKSFSSSYAKSVSIKIMPKTTSLVLPKKSGILTGIGSTLKIEEQVEPASIKENSLISYQSLNTDIATVDENGVVTAVRTGSTGIKVSTYDGIEDTFNVTVINTDSTLSEKELTVNKKATADIRSNGAEAYFTFIPKYSSKYNFMIEMQNYNSGSIYIYKGEKIEDLDDYIKYENGTSKADAVCEMTADQVYTVRVCFYSPYTTGTIDILVRELTKSLDITSDYGNMIVGLGKTMQLNAKVTTDSGENNAVTWSSEDASVATVDENGLVTSVNMGTTEITATTWDDVTKKYEVTVQEPQISLNHVVYNMRINDKFTLNPVLTYDDGSDYTGYKWDDVTFTSYDESVVRVTKSGNDKGIVKAVGKGRTVIGVIMRIDGRSYELSCEVNVKSPYLNTLNCYLYIGNTEKLKVYDKKGTPKWSSSNKKTVTVSDSGKLTAKKKGKAVISCSIDGIKLTCKVTVDTPYIIGTDGNLTAGISSNLRIIGSNSAKKEKWSSSNKKVLTVKKGKITAKKPGTATLKCKVNGITLKKKVKVYENVYSAKTAKTKDLLLDRIYYQVGKVYFSGNKLKVKLNLYNTYTDRKLKVIKALDVRLYANGKCLHQRVVNKKVNMKPYSKKSVTVTISKNGKWKNVIDLRNRAFTSDINLQTAYYSYKYTY